jgi:hypothetical protein
MLPVEVERAPLPTLVIRQGGQAWTRPFTAVFEPGAGAAAQVVGVDQVDDGRALALRVHTSGYGRQTIISGDGDDARFNRDGQRLQGRYAIVAERDDHLQYLFLGYGRELSALGYALSARSDGASAALWQANGNWSYSASRALRLQVPAADWPARLEFTLDGRPVRIQGQPGSAQGKRVLVYDMPAMGATSIR